MRKTSLYLPDGLKEELTALARRTGRSEAELVRSAVEQLVRSARSRPVAPPPEPALPAGPSLAGVGLGPSDPDLVTERARQVLRAADRVFAASTAPDAIGRAEAIVRAATPEVPVDRLVVDIAGTPDERARSMARAAATVLDALATGAAVAFVTLGDPNVYSSFPALARRVADARPDVPIATVPGLMAFQELAARTGTVLAEGDEHLTLVALGDDVGCLDEALQDRRGTLVVYKGGRRLPDLARRLAGLDRLDGAVVGELLGLPGGRSVPVAAVADRPASYLATVIVPAERDGQRSRDGGP